MRQTIFTSLRGADGRRLAAALACLMLVVALLGGFHTGMALAGDGAAVFCGHGAGGQPATGHTDPCCVAGCLSHAPALDAPSPPVAGPRLASGVLIAVRPARAPAHGGVLSSYRQRGPPSFA